jgi:hypothetical protein
VTWAEDASAFPAAPGWYVIVPHLSERPIVVWWSVLSTQWRIGLQAVRVDRWMGPL